MPCGDLSDCPNLADDERRVWRFAEAKMAACMGYNDDGKEKLRSFLANVMYDRRHGGEQRISNILITGSSAMDRAVLARTIADLLWALKLVNGKFAEVSSKDVGGKRMLAAFQKNEGGIVFLDEAHGLAKYRKAHKFFCEKLAAPRFSYPPVVGRLDRQGRAVANTLVIAAGDHVEMCNFLNERRRMWNRFSTNLFFDVETYARGE